MISEEERTAFEGGYREPYDPRPEIDRITRDRRNDDAWRALWENLHHQGDVGTASYAALTLLVDSVGSFPRKWNFYGLVAAIETARGTGRHPPLPEKLAAGYQEALRRSMAWAINDLREGVDEHLMPTIMAVVALASVATGLGSLLARLDPEEIKELVRERYG